MQLFCGDPICKKAVHADPAQLEPWPIRCGACGRSLYPKDVLEATHVSELGPKPGQLMRDAGGQLVAAMSADFGAPAQAEADAAVDRVMSMVASDGSTAQPPAAATLSGGIGAALLGGTVFRRRFRVDGAPDFELRGKKSFTGRWKYMELWQGDECLAPRWNKKELKDGQVHTLAPGRTLEVRMVSEFPEELVTIVDSELGDPDWTCPLTEADLLVLLRWQGLRGLLKAAVLGACSVAFVAPMFGSSFSTALLIWLGLVALLVAWAVWTAVAGWRLFKHPERTALMPNGRLATTKVGWAHGVTGAESRVDIHFIDGSSFQLGVGAADRFNVLLLLSDSCPHASFGYNDEAEAHYQQLCQQQPGAQSGTS